jgi:hypothetical protein
MAYIEHKKPKIPAGYQSLPVGATCVKLTAPTGSRYAVLKTSGACAIRWRDDGPSAVDNATGGVAVKEGSTIELHSAEQIAGFRAIGTGSTGATGNIDALYYKI